MSNALRLSVPDGLPYIDFEREFDHPAAAVFRAHGDPDLISRWLGPRGTNVVVDHYDFRTGGSYRYDHVGPDEKSYTFSGIFHTVREPELAIQTFEFGGYPDVVSLETMRLTALDGGRCRLNGRSVYPTVEARDGMAMSGMEEGLGDGYDRLDELLGGGSA